MLTETHLGGLLGPRFVAQTSIKVGLDFDGYLELEPTKDSLRPAIRRRPSFKRFF
jgi:hypothetical protein